MSTGNELVTLKQVNNYYKDLRDRQESLVKSYEKLTFPINKGTLCVYDGLTYISKQDISNSEPWTSSHWTATNIGDELTDVKNAIHQMQPAATNADIGKALIVKTVADGKPTSFEYGEAGSIDPQDIADAVDDWLDEHPEATTTVQDDSITTAKLASDLKEIVEYKNLINPKTLTVGRMGNDGSISDLNSYRTSDYILAEPGTYVLGRVNLLSGEVLAPDYCGYGLFNLDKTFIANSRVYQQYTTATTITITITNKCYIRITANKNYFEPAMQDGLYMLCKGSSLGVWKAYKAPTTYDKLIERKASEALILVPGKNLYDKNSCNHEDGYYYNSTTGSKTEGANYAITGKIPVEPNTEYVYSGATFVRANFFKSDGGYVKISSTSSNPFTTPADCTYVGITLFGASHSESDYNTAIASSMLEKAHTASAFEPYNEHRLFTLDAQQTDLKKTLRVKHVKDGKVDEWELMANDFLKDASLINVFDKSKAENGKYFNTSYNTVYENADYGYSGMVAVKPNTQYCFSKDESITTGNLSANYYEWAADGTFIQASSLGNATTVINQIHTGANTYFISFNITYSASHTAEEFAALIDTIMVVEGTQRPLQYVAYNEEPTVNHQKFDDMYHSNADRFRGKKWLVFGTSVSYQDSKKYTEGVAEGEIVRGYIGDVARRKPMIVTNSGISGSTLGDHGESALINRYTEFTYTDYDFVTIEYGINDFGNNIPVGTASDAKGTTTFAACLKTVIEYILTENPIIGLIICTDPCVRDSTNNNGNTLKDYADVTLEIAKQYRLPVCDWFYHSGINSITKGDGTSRYALTQSGTHPSVYGHMRMGAMLNQVFDSLLC